MKRMMVIFILLLVMTLLIPFVSVIRSDKESASDEIVTIFSSQAAAVFYIDKSTPRIAVNSLNG